MMETLTNEQIFKILNRNNIDSRGRVKDHHIPLYIPVEPIKGYYLPEFTKNPNIEDLDNRYDFKIRNKGYRNFAYLLNSYIVRSPQPIIEVNGGTWNQSGNDDSGPLYSCPPKFPIYPTAINYGSYTSPHDVSRYELYGRYWSQGASGLLWIEELDTETRWQTKHRWAFSGVNRTVGEVGLYFRYPVNDGAFWNLIARAIIDPAQEKFADTVYDEGWRITFPSNYTRWFLRAKIHLTVNGPYDLGLPAIASDGNTYIIRFVNCFAGNPDVRIGRSNLAPSPTHYNLQDPIGALSSQSQSVEIDTTLQECRIVRIGTYTPSVNETLGEIGLFTRVYDVGGTSREIMVARGTWVPTVTLVANTTYTIGIVLRFG
ncbi:hypothetical protein KEJ48_05140 [Candidatus Bathyarchaeota archaeon]|nr:hypothetical protein [Candidatus Bathyarchaeota archaeon]